MFILLVAGGLIYLLLGDTQEAMMLLGFVFVMTTRTFPNESAMKYGLPGCALSGIAVPPKIISRSIAWYSSLEPSHQ